MLKRSLKNVFHSAEDDTNSAPSMKPQTTIAFAPNSKPPLEELEGIVQMPILAKRPTDPERRVQRQVFDDGPRFKQKVFKQGKATLPRPYRKHWAEVEKRRAVREFINGRDEEYEVSERDCRVKTPCCGVLCFHALELLDLVVNKQSFLEAIPISYYCLLTIGQTKRCTKIVHALDPRQIKMDTFLHLSIEVSEWREAPGNKLRIELWSFQDPEAHFIVGTVEIHIYNFVRLQHFIDTTTLWSDGLKVGKLAYEVVFSYGAFGYGHSNQLMNFSQPIMETISHSMFPRIKLNDKVDIADVAFQARMPDELKLLTYHSLILEVDEKNPNLPFFRSSKVRRVNRIDLEPKPMVVQQVEFEQGFPIHCRLHMNIWQKVLQPDFNDMFGEFICIGNKRGRLDYLTNLVQGRMRDMYEDEVSPLFNHLKEKDLDIINRAYNNPNEVLFPKNVPCPSSEAYTIAAEDISFQDKFPTFRREPGYLATLFGYESKDESSTKMRNETVSEEMQFLSTHNEMFQMNKNEDKEKFNFFEWIVGLLVKWKLICIKIFNCIFPELHEPMEVPEISVTVASPEGSTTNIYSYFTREAAASAANTKVDRLVKQTTALMDMTRKTQVQKKYSHGQNSSDSSFSSD